MTQLTVAANQSEDFNLDPPLVTIDFEASCLPAWGSYPIEVAACVVATGASKSWLIKPQNSWLRTGLWKPEAERLHGISREMLCDQGRPVEEVREELGAFVGPRAVSDSVICDGYWLEILYAREPDFGVECVSAALARIGRCPPAVSQAEIENARQTASIRFPRRHHARSDCERIAEALRILIHSTPISAATHSDQIDFENLDASLDQRLSA